MATQKDKPFRFIEVVDLASDDRDDDSDIEFVSSSSSALKASLSSKSSSRANSSTGTGTPHRKQPQPAEIWDDDFYSGFSTSNTLPSAFDEPRLRVKHDDAHQPKSDSRNSSGFTPSTTRREDDPAKYNANELSGEVCVKKEGTLISVKKLAKEEGPSIKSDWTANDEQCIPVKKKDEWPMNHSSVSAKIPRYIEGTFLPLLPPDAIASIKEKVEEHYNNWRQEMLSSTQKRDDDLFSKGFDDVVFNISLQEESFGDEHPSSASLQVILSGTSNMVSFGQECVDQFVRQAKQWHNLKVLAELDATTRYDVKIQVPLITGPIQSQAEISDLADYYVNMGVSSYSIKVPYIPHIARSQLQGLNILYFQLSV